LEQAATQAKKQGKREKGKREERRKAVETAALKEGVELLPVKEGWKVVEEYWVVEPYAKVKIVEIPELGGQKAYYAEEVQLTEGERRAVDKLIDILSVELEPPASFETDVRQHILEQARRLAEKYRSAVRVPKASWGKVLYYVERDLVGYGPIEVLMRDYKLEDVSCDGVDRPVHVWHRDYESIPTNIVFRGRDALREFVVKLAHMAGKHISAAFPIVDAMLPGRHRLAATYGEEVSPKGSTFTIRKFRERPFSIVELIESGNIDPWTAAYLWLMIENKMTVMVIGATAAGKTTFLNALTNFFKPGFKVVTIEETPELNLPHENWVQLTSRESYGLGASKVGEITLYDLVRLSLRYRPDYIIVGEVRGAEAFVLFQAMASVSRDTPVLIKRGEGAVELIPIGEFVDKFYSEGEERIPKGLEGYYTLSHDGFSAVWKPIKYVLRHRVDEIYEVLIEGGGRVEATGSHSVFTLDPETLDVVEKPVAHLKPGNFLVTFVKNSPAHKDYAAIDVVALFRERKGVEVTDLPAELRALTGGRNPIPLAEYLRLERGEGERSSVKVRMKRSKYALPGRVLLDEDLAFVLGAYIADGCVKKYKGKRVCFTFGVKKRSIAHKVAEVLQRKFGVRPTVDDRESYAIYEYNHTLLAELFEKLLGGELPEKRVPPHLWISPPSVVREFFEGLKADSRGTLRKRYVCYTTANEKLAYQLIWLARIAGFYSTLGVEEGRGRNEGKRYYTVRVHLDKEHRKPNASEKVPVELLEKLRELAKPKSMPLELTYVWRRRSVSKKTALKVIGWVLEKGNFNHEARAYLSRLLQLTSGDLALVEVKDVRKKPYRGFVYDLSVPDSESFFGGSTPVLLHNTGHGGMSTMHAESLWAAIRRLTSPPMNVAPAYIPALNIATYVERTLLPDGRVGRRLRNLWEVEDHDKYREIVRWDPATDKHAIVGSSVHLATVAARVGKSVEEVMEEIERRRTVLEWMKLKGVRDTNDVFVWINRYYIDPRSVYELARGELEELRMKPKPPLVAPLPREEVVVQVAAPKPAARQAAQSEPLTRLRSLSTIVRARAAGGPPLSREAAAALRALRELGGQGDRAAISRRTSLPQQVLSKALSELARRGFVEVSLTYTGDGVKIVYKITPEGERAAAEL
jgi:flagellar protein FlaI